MASRIPYGTEVTADRLAKIEQMETMLRRLDFHDLRARLVSGNDDMVRIELGETELLMRSSVSPSSIRTMSSLPDTSRARRS